MAHYRKIDARMWNDAKFCALSERGKLGFVFLLTHPNQTMIGAMRATIPGLAAELYSVSDAYRPQALLKGFKEGFEEGYLEALLEGVSKGMVKYDDKACLIWLPNFIKYNAPESPNVIKSWPRVFDLLPECALKDVIYQRLDVYTQGLTEAFRVAFVKAFTEGKPKAMPNQEQEQEQDINLNLPTSLVGSSEQSKPFVTLLLQNDKTFPISESQVLTWIDRYPGVDVRQQLKSMVGWHAANPKKRKTKNGILKSVESWLKREQDEHPKGKAKAAAALPRDIRAGRSSNQDGSLKL